MKTKDIIISVFALSILGAIGFLWFSPSGIQKAPGLELQLIDGNKINLEELKGKPVMVTFWSTSCSGCIKEMPHLTQMYNKLHNQGLEIIGIAMPYDRPDFVMEMVKAKKLPYKIAYDIKSEAVVAFGNVSLTPTTFLIDHNGKIVKKKIGEFNQASWEKRIEAIIAASGTG